MPQYPYSPVNNDLGALVTLAAATTGGNSAVQTNSQARGVRVVIDITAVSGATLTVTIQSYDAASNTYNTLLASAGLTATGVTALLVYPGAAVSANISANSVLSPKWRVNYTVSGGTVTATIGAQLQV